MLDVYLLNACSIIEVSHFLQDDKTRNIKDTEYQTKTANARPKMFPWFPWNRLLHAHTPPNYPAG